MLERIMVALDGSPLANQAVPFAAALAGAFDAEMILLRVVEMGDGLPGRSLDSFDWRLDRAEAIEYLSGIQRHLREQGLVVDIDVTAGRASEEILEIARAREIGLLVLTSHGTGGVSQFRMAGTAQKVVSGSDTSVLMVPASDNAPEGPAFTSVLIPVDGSPHSAWGVSIAARLARFQKADLIILQVVKTPSLLDPRGTVRETQIVDELIGMNRRAAVRYVEGLRRRFECPGVTVHSRVEVADHIAPVLEQQAKQAGRPLVVLSPCGDSRFGDGPYDGLATVMLAKTEHPVLVLREPNMRECSHSGWRRRTTSAIPRRATTPF